LTTQGEILGVQKGSGVLEIHQEFSGSIRPMFIINSKKERTNPMQVYIHGTTPAGAHRVDHIPAYRIRWNQGTGVITSDYTYRSIEQIEITGLLDESEVVIRSADLMILDQTLLIPLWAGVPESEKAGVLTNLTILNKKKFLGPYGLRSRIDTSPQMDISEENYKMHLPWISLIMEGMVRYGMHVQAAELFTRMMNAIIPPLSKQLIFFQSYHSETGVPSGYTNTLSSLLPLGLFLKICGVEIINPTKVKITRGNPFPWPVTIKYRGLTVVQQEKKSLVIFPDGQNISIDNSHPQTVLMKSP
jgi:hypothetical protein